LKVKHLLAVIFCLPLFAKAQYSTVTLEDRPIKVVVSTDYEVEKFVHSLPQYNSLSDQARELLYWTNYSRKNPRKFWDSICAPIISLFPQLKMGPYAQSLKADLYSSPSLPLLRINDTLTRIAQAHADDIGLKQGKFHHNSTDGTTFQQRFRKAGLRNFGGENISLGAGKMLLSLVMLYLDHGLDYPGHRITLLNRDYTNIGLGLREYGNSGSTFMVQDFSSPQ
jgi:hypothetical protein